MNDAERLTLALSWVLDPKDREIALAALARMEARQKTLEEAMERLCSMQTFTVALDLKHSTAEAIARELVARGEYACSVLGGGQQEQA